MTTRWEQPSRWTRTICHADGEGAGDGGGGAGAGGAGGAGGGAGAGDGAGGTGGAAGGAGELPFYESFTRDTLKTDPKIQGFKTVEDLAGAYVNLEKRFGVDPNRRLDLPADPKDEAGWKSVWAKLGTPEKIEGYELKLADGAPAEDVALFGRFLETAHGANMPKPFVEAAMKFWDSEMARERAAAETARKEAYDKGVATLKTEWGEAFEQRGREVGAALLKYGTPELAKALDVDGMGNYPALAIAIGKMVERMAEPAGGGGLQGGLGADAKLTPAQAKAESRKQEAHPAFLDAKHPEHKAVVEERNRLLAMAEPIT